MRLKIFTTACVIAGLVMMALFPWILGMRPEGDAATKIALAEWGRMVLIYIAFTCFFCLAAFGGAIGVMRQAKREFLQETRKNLDELIEGTLEDHGRE